MRRRVQHGKPGDKHCHNCDTTKPKSEFYLDRARSDGLNVKCIECLLTKRKRVKMPRHFSQMETDEQRKAWFLERTVPEPNTGCWLWLRKVDNWGYGIACFGKYRGTSVHASRAAWELFVGPVPEGMSVCHKCDTPLCCNPSHMFLGSHQDNMRDMSLKGRAYKGKPGRALRLTADAAREIRRKRDEGWSFYRLAQEYGVSRSTIRLVTTGETWKDAA